MRANEHNHTKKNHVF